MKKKILRGLLLVSMCLATCTILTFLWLLDKEVTVNVYALVGAGAVGTYFGKLANRLCKKLGL